jgi:hypothetical protein
MNQEPPALILGYCSCVVMYNATTLLEERKNAKKTDWTYTGNFDEEFDQQSPLFYIWFI